MPYILEKMLTVRVHRENKALNHMVQSKARLEQALSMKQQKETELSEYRGWRRQEEQRLFHQLQSRPATVRDAMVFADTIRTLRADQQVKQQQVAEARKQAASAEDRFEQARRSYAEAYRKKEKIEEHKSLWEQEHRLRMEQDAEKESEEFVRIKI